MQDLARRSWSLLQLLPFSFGPALQRFEADHKFTIEEIVDISNESRVPALLDALKARSFGYELTSTDLCDIHSETKIRAAENPNPNILRGLLRFDKLYYPDISKEWGGMFALLKAVRHQPVLNVILLLSKGADTNGCSYHCLSQWSARFLRFRPSIHLKRLETRESILATLPVDQDSPITEKELEARRSCRGRFWAEIDDPPNSKLIAPVLTAIELAARLGHDDEITAFCLAGADTAAWRNHYTSMPRQPHHANSRGS